MWLDNLKELKAKKGLSKKQIADMANLPQKTVDRIFSGESTNPYADTLYRIVVVLGGSLDDVLTDSKAVVGSKSLATMEEELDTLRIQFDALLAENALLVGQVDNLTTENATLKEKKSEIESTVASLTAERDILKLKLEHKEELLAMHNYYNQRKPN